MNKAYKNYLQDALDHYMVNDDEDEAIQLFLEFLETYHPETIDGAVEEPDAWTYAESDNFYPTVMIDKTMLQGFRHRRQ